MTRMFGVDDEFGEDAILGRLEGMKDVIEQVNRQFKDPVRASVLYSFMIIVIIMISLVIICTPFLFSCLVAFFQPRTSIRRN